jgi:DNA mismatch endonuclease, patch repair protein
MQAIRSKDTAPELAVRRRLHAEGFRFRVAHRPLKDLRRTADIVFTRRKLAVFIDGCFWHSCPVHVPAVSQNSDYWNPKLFRNRQRDEETNVLLKEAGWTVLRFWAHEDPEKVAAAVASEVRALTFSES